MNEFEKSLKELFPDVYDLAMLTKPEETGGGGEVHLWALIQQLLDMRKTVSTGKITISYTRGHIDSLRVEKDALAFTKSRPKPSAVDNDASPTLK